MMTLQTRQTRTMTLMMMVVPEEEEGVEAGGVCRLMKKKVLTQGGMYCLP